MPMSKKETCLILGGGGFIGSHLADKLLSSGYEVSVFDKLNFSKRNIADIIDKVNVIEGDFNNEIDVSKALEGADYVYHLVSSTLPASSNDNPVYDVETNLISSLNLFRSCVENKIRKVIFLSSGGTVYGIPETIPIPETHRCSPITSYGIVKKTIEDYLYMFEKLHGLQYHVFRLSNPYGERQNPMAAQGAIPVFINKILKEGVVEIWGDGEVVRDYIYISDAVEVLAGSLSVDSNERIFNLSSCTGYSLNEIIQVIRSVSGKIPKIFRKEGRPIDVPVNILDNTLVKKIFGWKPEVTIEDGIARTYNYILNHH